MLPPHSRFTQYATHDRAENQVTKLEWAADKTTWGLKEKHPAFFKGSWAATGHAAGGSEPGYGWFAEAGSAFDAKQTITMICCVVQPTFGCGGLNLKGMP